MYHIVSGYRLYATLLKIYGVNVNILYTVPFGTGDYYICGLYLKNWRKKNNIENYVFLVPDRGAERRVINLFESFWDHTYECKKHWRDICSLNAFNTLLNYEFQNIKYLHHREPAFKNTSFRLTYDRLQGFKGWNMVDYYLTYGYSLPLDSPKDIPSFTDSSLIEDKYFGGEYKLKKGRTVILSPNSTGLSRFSLPNAFWKELSDFFVSAGFIVVTNCFGKEKPIEGSYAIPIPYTEIVPLAELCGYFVGIRSGLCDIVSSAKCKKHIIHTYYATFWPIGESITYTGLNNMCLCDDAFEYEYNPRSGYSEIMEHIVSNVCGDR
ncbi:MAG: hypothetical protein IJS12_08800 [Lachnospiraceae bacterium]|nr:hypothetical protein [Lachnospiraceae bacterium]